MDVELQPAGSKKDDVLLVVEPREGGPDSGEPVVALDTHLAEKSMRSEAGHAALAQFGAPQASYRKVAFGRGDESPERKRLASGNAVSDQAKFIDLVSGIFMLDCFIQPSWLRGALGRGRSRSVWSLLLCLY